MKLPRDVAASDLEKALRRVFGYEVSRQSGSHRRLTTQTGGQHHLTVPAHNPIKPGTLRAILGEVASHHRLPLEDVLQQLDL
jgi:predicted RNA binding protein YcfA (HicA-like mRNA interferase family)